MRAVRAKARRILTRFCRVFLLAALLAGCAAPVPRAVTLPPVRPAAPATPPQANTVLPEFLPVLNADGLTPSQIGGEVLRVRVESAALYQSCRANNSALADWARAHSEE